MKHVHPDRRLPVTSRGSQLAFDPGAADGFPFHIFSLYQDDTPEPHSHDFMEHLTRIRIDQARRMLTESDDPVAAIALDLGFQDASYFSRLFKKETGQTPGAFRKEERHNAGDKKGTKAHRHKADESIGR